MPKTAYAVIPIAVFLIIDAGTASSSPFQRIPKNVHDHPGIVFTFYWNPRSRCAGNRDHDRPQYAACVLWTNYSAALECRQSATTEPGESVTAILGWIIIGVIFGLPSLALLWPGYRLMLRAYPNSTWAVRGYITATAVCGVILWFAGPLVVHSLFGHTAP